jgi:hypothetical protein
MIITSPTVAYAGDALNVRFETDPTHARVYVKLFRNGEELTTVMSLTRDQLRDLDDATKGPA